MKSLQQFKSKINRIDPHQVHRVVFALLIGLMIGFGTATLVASPKFLDRSAQATSVLKNPGIEASKSALIQAPVRLQLPRQQIDLSILMGSFSKSLDDWYIDDRHAFFATLSSLPAQDTNTTIIYGHNTDVVLGKTTSIQRGDSLLVTHSDGHITKWRFVSDKLVEPDDVKIFSRQSEVPTVVLLTCNGNNSERRRLMFFEQI
jgi:LPXTG-site transpeptidase (sortase) family protein